MNKRGTPENFTYHEGRARAFPTEEDAREHLITGFAKYIRIEKEFSVAPTNVVLAEKEGVDRRTIYMTLNVYYPNLKKEFLDNIADLLSEGALLGKYNPTMTIFCLKNWCDWTDKQEQKIDMNATVSYEEMLRRMREGRSGQS